MVVPFFHRKHCTGIAVDKPCSQISMSLLLPIPFSGLSVKRLYSNNTFKSPFFCLHKTLLRPVLTQDSGTVLHHFHLLSLHWAPGYILLQQGVPHWRAGNTLCVSWNAKHEQINFARPVLFFAWSVYYFST